uniref:Uncharacterized protein n=1 Tax=Solanum tuberosum TaxID=4113 RepID=M1B2V5_SOLTU
MNVLPSESKEKKETTSLTTSAKESSKCYNLRTTSIYLPEELEKKSSNAFQLTFKDQMTRADLP